MDPFLELLSSHGRQGVHPETLSMLGQRAASEFMEGRSSLNDAVVKVASEHPELNNEHVKRVTEYANTTTFQQLFEKSADKNVHFEIADPAVVLRNLRDGRHPESAGPLATSKNSDYAAPPVSAAHREKDSSGSLEDAFNTYATRNQTDGIAGSGEPIQKEASASLPGQHANPVEDLFDLHVQLRDAKEKLASAAATCAHDRYRAEEDFYRSLRREVLDPDGAGLGGAIGALGDFGQEKVAAVLPGMTERLLSDGVYPMTLRQSMAKTAGRLVNPNHPLLQSFGRMVKAAEAQVRADAALSEVSEMLRQTSEALRRCAA